MGCFRYRVVEGAIHLCPSGLHRSRWLRISSIGCAAPHCFWCGALLVSSGVSHPLRDLREIGLRLRLKRRFTFDPVRKESRFSNGVNSLQFHREVIFGVVKADVLDHFAKQSHIGWQKPCLDIGAEIIAQDSAEILVPRV